MSYNDFDQKTTKKGGRLLSLENLIIDMLNIKSENIEKIISISQQNNAVIIKITMKRDPNCKCPICNEKAKILGYYPRKLTHSTLVNRKCTIIYNQRRYYCPTCEFSFHENNPFINTKENVTYETKINVLNDLKDCGVTYTLIAKRYNLSVTKVEKIFDAHVDISRKTLPRILSIDEHYFPFSSYDSLYCCVLMDFETGVIIDILPDRKKAYVSNYFNNIKNATLDDRTKISELNNVEFVSIDLYDNYRDIAHKYFPTALVCADSFHVIKHLTDAFKDVRLRCRRSTEDKDLQYLLTTFKHIFHHDMDVDNMPRYNKRFKRKMNYRDMMTILFERFPDLKTAYELKEKYISFNLMATRENVEELLPSLLIDFANCNIPEYDEFYNLLRNWYNEIINSFNTACNKRINNSYIESRNRQIERLLFNANGYTNFKRARNRMLYCLNKDDTYKI